MKASTHKKFLLNGFINKKITLTLFVSIVLFFAVYGAIRALFEYRKNQANVSHQSQFMQNSAPGKSTMTTTATREQQCVICKSIIKAGATSSCMKTLACK